MDSFHTIVIGAGSGGLTVAVGLANLGRPVALVEAGDVGGDCTNVGCIPSKTLIHLADTAPEDGAAALAEVRRKRDALRDRETREFAEVPNLALIFGRARLTGPTTVAVALRGGGERALSAGRVVVATGGRPRRIPIEGLPDERALTNESVFELARPPRHLAIVGGGAIGVELAFAFSKLGSRVSVVDSAPRILAPFLPEVSATMAEALRERGVAVHTGAEVRSYDPGSGALHLEGGGSALALDGVDYVLLAAGRRRNLDGLGLEAAGVRYDEREGVATDSYGRTSVGRVYAVGDVTATSRFTHSANAQGRRAVQRIAFPWLPARGPEPLYPSATFSDPEIATVGMSADEIAARFHPGVLRRLRFELPDLDRGYTDGLRRGFIIVDAVRLSGRILAVTIVGPRATEIISLFTLAIVEGISLYRLYRLVYPYPTYSGAVQKLADAFVRETLPNFGGELGAYLRYRLARPPRRGSGAAGPGGDGAQRALQPAGGAGREA